ncbi:hypothetical protein EDD11_004358 [Mortierella claussenii]|nr:hypothetical protein EDD11_004358 [Mortierella claussenii]
MAGAVFRDHAKFTNTALECLAKLALSSDGTTECSVTQLLSRSVWTLKKLETESLEAKLKEAQQEAQSHAGSSWETSGEAKGPKIEQKSAEYQNLSIDDTLRWFSRSKRKSGQKVRATRLDHQPSMPFTTVKVHVSRVMNAFIVMEANKKGRCTSISRLVVFGAGEDNSIWEDSSHLVFKKITQIAVGAVDYFMNKEPQSLLGLVLEWLATYSTLFTAPCAGCGKHLFFDSQQFKHLPPTLYTYNQPTQPFHPQCLA